MAWFEDWKYEHPVSYRMTFAVVVIALAGAAVAALPENDATKAMGLVALKDRCVALRSALYWESRAAIHPGADLAPPAVDYGFVVGIDFDGGLFISVPVGRQFVQRKVKLADIQIVDVQGVANLIRHKRELDAKIERYGETAVVWIEGQPLNVQLVTARLAKPDPNPPTNIVDEIFATYFWNTVKGNPE